MLKRKDLTEGTIEKVEYPNRGTYIAETGQKVVVKNTIPGQKVRHRITKKHANKVEGRLLEVLEASPLETREPLCGIFPACGGCTYQTLPYEEQLRLKEEQLRELLAPVMEEDTVWDGIFRSPEETGYRNKMEFSFGDDRPGGPLTLGLHKKGSTYDVLTADTCRIVPEDMTKILAEVLAYCREMHFPKYNKMNHTGYLRYLLLRHSVSADEIFAVLVTTHQEEHDFTPLAERLKALPLQGSLVGFFHAYEDSFSDDLKCEEMIPLFGRDWFYEELLGLRFKVTTASFFQTNSRGAEVLYGLVRSYVSESLREGRSGRPVLYDLYSGTGTIAQILSPAASHVYGVEIVEDAVAAARENAALNGIGNCTFLAGDVLEKLGEIEERPDYVILDPPREGVNPKALRQIMQYDIPAMVYISCKATSFVNDMLTLRAAGWRIRRAALVDLFPETCHVETVVLLGRKNDEVTDYAYVPYEPDPDKLKDLPGNASYREIKEWIYSKYKTNVSSLNVAQVKRKHGIIERENYYKGADGHKVPTCPKEKEEMIEEALKHFRMI